MRLQDRGAIVTGSSQGIGRACAVTMAREGAVLRRLIPRLPSVTPPDNGA